MVRPCVHYVLGIVCLVLGIGGALCTAFLLGLHGRSAVHDREATVVLDTVTAHLKSRAAALHSVAQFVAQGLVPQPSLVEPGARTALWEARAQVRAQHKDCPTNVTVRYTAGGADMLCLSSDLDCGDQWIYGDAECPRTTVGCAKAHAVQSLSLSSVPLCIGLGPALVF